MFGKTGLQRLGIQRQAFPVFVPIGIVDQIRHGIIDANTHIAVVKNLADLVADRIVDALNVQFRGECGLNTVDDRQLGVALLGFLE